MSRCCSMASPVTSAGLGKEFVAEEQMAVSENLRRPAGAGLHGDGADIDQRILQRRHAGRAGSANHPRPAGWQAVGSQAPGSWHPGAPHPTGWRSARTGRTGGRAPACRAVRRFLSAHSASRARAFLRKPSCVSCAGAPPSPISRIFSNTCWKFSAMARFLPARTRDFLEHLYQFYSQNPQKTSLPGNNLRALLKVV